MGQYSVGDALNQFFEQSNWKEKMFQIRLKEEWKEIAGSTIARYTRDLFLHQKILYISTDIAALKQELQLGKLQFIERINAYFKEAAIKDIVIR